jgi:hypothetical protein
MKEYVFKTRNNMSQWICGVDFKNGMTVTIDSVLAEELRKCSIVEEVILEEPKEVNPTKPKKG